MKAPVVSLQTKVLIAVVVVYAVLIAYLVSSHDVIASRVDPIEYIEGSRDLANYDSPYHPPFYSVAIAGVAVIFGDPFLAAKIVAMVSTISMILLTYALGIACFRDRSVALFASVLVAASPTIIRLGYGVYSDTLGAALFLGCTYALVKSNNSRIKWPVAAGILAGLAYLTRYVYVSVIPASALLFMAVLPGGTKKRFVKFALFLLSFILVIAPWTLATISRHGDLHNLNHVNIAFAIFDTTNSWLLFEQYEKDYPTFFSLIGSHPLPVLWHWAKNAFYFPSAVVIRCCLLAGVFAIPGIFSVARKPTAERMAFLVNGAVLLCMSLLAWLQARFFVAFIPFIALVGSHFILRGLGRSAAEYYPGGSPFVSLLGRIPIRLCTLILCIAVAFGYCVRKVPDDLARANIDDEKRAGEMLESLTPEGTSILTTSQNLAWYANRPFVDMSVLGMLSPGDLEEAVMQTDAEVLVYTKRHSPYTHPQLEFLLDPIDDRIPDSFHLIYHAEGEWPVVAYWIGDRSP